MADRERILKIRDLNISFKTDNGNVKAIRGVNLDLYKGETIAIVGESGSGKSVTTKAIMGILASNGTIDSGTIDYVWYDEYTGERQERDIVQCLNANFKKKFVVVRSPWYSKDPMTSLNPTMTIGRQVMEPMMYHYKKANRKLIKKHWNC